MLYSSK